ncbi:unnamed protein product [Symbiodinium sp. CCMP2456]|nr:unnamed protein product [Symbiodinium sp. CCMP2456]
MDALGALDSLSEDESHEEMAETFLEKPLDFQALQPHLRKESEEEAEGLDRIYIKFKEKLATTATEDGEVTSTDPPQSRDQQNAELPVLQTTRRPTPASLVDGAYEKSQPQKILDYDVEQSEGDLRLQSLLQGDFCRKCGMKMCRCVDYSDHARKRPFSWPMHSQSKASKKRRAKGPGPGPARP